MNRNEIIFFAGIAIVVIVGEVGNDNYGVGCLAFPLLLILMFLTFYVFPIKKDE